MSFLAVIAAMAILAAVAYTELSRIDRLARSTRDSTVPELSYSSQLLAAWNENFSITQELVTQQEGSELDQLSGEIRTNRAKVADLIIKYETVASGEGADLPGPVMALVAEYQAIQDKILKAAADISALPVGPGSSLQRSALVSQAIALLHGELNPQFDKVRDAIEKMVKLSNATADEVGCEHHRRCCRRQVRHRRRHRRGSGDCAGERASPSTRGDPAARLAGGHHGPHPRGRLHAAC